MKHLHELAELCLKKAEECAEMAIKSDSHGEYEGRDKYFMNALKLTCDCRKLLEDVEFIKKHIKHNPHLNVAEQPQKSVFSD
ncbi:MAG: hypothetical protein LBC86_09675 [Oscillospiraceae bacterium]|jgi:hypothetical protein|nr:hypothetical protein [Oscillospiraceae bacterium]